jgi:hypothetical protein
LIRIPGRKRYPKLSDLNHIETLWSVLRPHPIQNSLDLLAVLSGFLQRAGLLDQLLLPQTKPNVRTAAAGILREADTAVRQELSGLDPPDGSSTSWPNSRRCSSVIVVRRYWTSTGRLRTKTTWATSAMPVIQE